MFTYERRAYYHETDQMGVIHHANYIKWMEEARIALMDYLGFSYKKMEDLGVISPVTGIDLEYKNPTRFNDNVLINVKVSEYSGVKLTIEYEIVSKDSGELRALGHSKHCFLMNGRIVSLKRSLPEFNEAFTKYIEENKD
ncbi:MAG: acyl-CoA thioesterase [Acholeplasmatales bacterium]|nr:acyl-CoA thioesterase [Acholeplasmatales bacterium]